MSPDYFRAQPSIYHRLRRAGKAGKIYYYAKWSGTQGMTFLLADQRDFFGLFGDFKKACERNTLPSYSFVEPAYSDNAGELATDQHPADLIRAGADVEELGVAIIALDRPVLGVARTTERLDRLVRDTNRIFRS